MIVFSIYEAVELSADSLANKSIFSSLSSTNQVILLLLILLSLVAAQVEKLIKRLSSEMNSDFAENTVKEITTLMVSATTLTEILNGNRINLRYILC